MEGVEPVPQLEDSTQPRFKSWLAGGRGATVAWLLPVLVVGITGWLGSLHAPLLVSTWLAAIGGSALGIVVYVGLEPAPYARRIAPAAGAVVGVALLMLLSWQAGHPLLK